MALAILVPCAHCGNLTPMKAWTKKRDGSSCDNTFCNRVCYDLYRSAIRSKRAIPCSHCGVEFIPDMATKKFCSGECWSAARKAKPKNCVNCGCIFTPVKMIRRHFGIEWISHNTGKTCSKECQIAWNTNNIDRNRKIGAAFKGKNHPNWKGGRTWASCISFRGSGWSDIAESVRKRDRYKCQHCGMSQEQHVEKVGAALEVHHKEPFHNFRNAREANARSNLIALCKPCHKRAEAAVPAVQMILPLANNRSGQRPGIERGEDRYCAKLTQIDVLKIREAKGKMPGPAVARMYGVQNGTIYNIWNRKTWTHI